MHYKTSNIRNSYANRLSRGIKMYGLINNKELPRSPMNIALNHECLTVARATVSIFTYYVTCYL